MWCTGLLTFSVRDCAGLRALPEALGLCEALESVDLTNCPQLSFPPSHVQDKPVKHIVAFLRAAHLLTQNKDKDGLYERMKEFSEDKHVASEIGRAHV